jgi:chromosome segregation ATPase
MEFKEDELRKLHDKFDEYKDRIAVQFEKLQENKNIADSELPRAEALKDLADYKERTQILQKQIEELNTLKDKEVFQLKSELEEKTGLLNEINAKENELSDELKVRERLINDKEQEKQQLESQIKEKDGRLNELEDRLKNIESKTEAYSNDQAQIHQELQQKNSRIKELEEKISNTVSSEELAVKDGEIEQLNKKIESLKSGIKEVEEISKSDFDKEIEIKEKIIAELKKGLEEAIKEIESKNNQVKDLTSGKSNIADEKTYKEYEEKLKNIINENEDLKGRVQELKAQLDVGLDEMRKEAAPVVSPEVDTKEVEAKWKKKWEKREQEIQDFVTKAKKSIEDKNKLKLQLETALQDQKTLSQLAEKEGRQKKEYVRKHAELIQMLEDTKKPFLRKLLDKLKGTKGIVFL